MEKMGLCMVLNINYCRVKKKYQYIASGLDYPGIGSKHCYLNEIECVKYRMIDNKEAVEVFYCLSKKEGTIPALESSHAITYALKLAKSKRYKSILVNLSCRCDKKNIEFVLNRFKRA